MIYDNLYLQTYDPPTNYYNYGDHYNSLPAPHQPVCYPWQPQVESNYSWNKVTLINHSLSYSKNPCSEHPLPMAGYTDPSYQAVRTWQQAYHYDNQAYSPTGSQGYQVLDASNIVLYPDRKIQGILKNNQSVPSPDMKMNQSVLTQWEEGQTSFCGNPYSNVKETINTSSKEDINNFISFGCTLRDKVKNTALLNKKPPPVPPKQNRKKVSRNDVIRVPAVVKSVPSGYPNSNGIASNQGKKLQSNQPNKAKKKQKVKPPIRKSSLSTKSTKVLQSINQLKKQDQESLCSWSNTTTATPQSLTPSSNAESPSVQNKGSQFLFPELNAANLRANNQNFIAIRGVGGESDTDSEFSRNHNYFRSKKQKEVYNPYYTSSSGYNSLSKGHVHFSDHIDEIPPPWEWDDQPEVQFSSPGLLQGDLNRQLLQLKMIEEPQSGKQGPVSGIM